MRAGRGKGDIIGGGPKKKNNSKNGERWKLTWGKRIKWEGECFSYLTELGISEHGGILKKYISGGEKERTTENSV